MLVVPLGKRAYLLAVIVVGGFTLILLTLYHVPFGRSGELFYRNHDQYHLVDVSVLRPDASYNERCFEGRLSTSVGQLLANSYLWGNSTEPHCRRLHGRFVALYSLELRHAPLVFGPELRGKLRVWLGNRSDLVDQATRQAVLTVHDEYSHRTTVYNALRGQRPVKKSQKPSRVFIKEIIDTSKMSCDFCHPLTMTAKDVFGRISGRYSISAGNVFKLEKWHSLFLSFKHDAIDIGEDEFLDLFNTSLKWFRKVHSVDPSAKYPVLFWDMFPHAGASQVHMHVHGMVGIGQYSGRWNDLLSAIRSYHAAHADHYWDNLIEIHQALGLALRVRDVVVVAPISGQRDHELWLITREPSVHLFRLLYHVTKMYQDDLDRFCYSMGAALPSLGRRVIDPERSLPAIIQVSTRGDCSTDVNDVSSVELYLFNNVNSDPYATIGKLRQYLRSQADASGHLEGMIDLWAEGHD